MAETPNGNDTTAGQGAGASNEAPPQQFAIQKIYLKDCSLETPATPGVFRETWKPEARVELNTRHQPMDENLHEVVVTVTVTAQKDDQTIYLCEIHQAGVFAVSGFSETAQAQLLGAYCPGVLFPYAREAVTDLTAKAGFPPMTLAPVNFEALYARRRQQEAAAADAPETTQ